MTISHTVLVIPPTTWLNANQRHSHWSQRSGPTAEWRKAAAIYTRAARIPALERATITAVVHRADRRTDTDAQNRYPTIKAAVDGVVDAGVLPDDKDGCLLALTIRPGEPVARKDYPRGLLELIIEEALVARIRTIKPEFFTSLTIADLSLEARLTFIGLWTHVDDDGRCVDDARLIKAALWPLDDRTAADVAGDLQELTESSLITQYKVGDRSYLVVNSWREHQRINRRTASKLPGPEQATDTGDSRASDPDREPVTSGNEDEASAHAPLTEESVSPHGGLTGGKERKGTGKGKERNSCAPQAERETHVAPPLIPEPERAPEPGSDDDPEWRKFWEIYPRKKAKDGARKSWKAALKKAPAETIIAGAERYRAEREGQDSNFTAYPTTWLNQGCWADEPDPRRATASAHQPYQDPDRTAYHQGSI